MSCSRPINDVDVTGRERGPAGRCRRGRRRRSARPARGREPLAQEQGEVVADEPPELPRADGTSGTSRSPRDLDLVDHGRQPRLPVRRRRLDVQQPGHRMGEPELVLQTRDVHARPDPAVPLPVQADEDVGLRQVGPVQLARWVRSSPELEQHRREPQRRDGTGHRGTLVGELGQRGAHEDAQTLVRGPDRDVPRLPLRHLRLRVVHRPNRKAGAHAVRDGVAPESVRLARAYRRASNSSSVSSFSRAPRFSLRCSSDSVPGIGSVVGERISSHARATCAGVAPWRLPISASAGPPSPRRGKKGTKTMPSAAQWFDDVLAGALRQVVVVLDRHDRHHLTRPLDLVDPDLGEADVTDPPPVPVLLDGGEAVLERRVRMDAVQVVERDAVRTQPAQGVLDLRPEHLGAAVPGGVATLARHDAVGRDWREGGADRLLALSPGVEVGGVDVAHAGGDRLPDEGDVRGRVGEPVRPGARCGRPGCGRASARAAPFAAASVELHRLTWTRRTGLDGPFHVLLRRSAGVTSCRRPCASRPSAESRPRRMGRTGRSADLS